MGNIVYQVEFKTEEQRDEFAAMVDFLTNKYNESAAVISDIIYSSNALKEYRESGDINKNE